MNLREILSVVRGRARWASFCKSLQRLIPALKIPGPDSAATLKRIEIMERDLVLPLKAAGIAMLLHSFYFTPWFGNVLGALEIAVETTQYVLWIYTLLSAVTAILLLLMWRIPPGLVQWIAFASTLMDGILCAALTLVSGGYDSILYWLFVGLIMRASVSVPRATSQLMLSFTLIACYIMAGLIDIKISELSPYLDEGMLIALDLPNGLQSPTEPLMLRLLLLVLVAFCAYGVQVLLERQRQMESEAREFGFREGQLRAAGRLAAEFAHQMKNPLAIINNTLFSLEQSLKKERTDVQEQLHMMREEIQRTDRIITELMGYAQLSEGRVEKLIVREELDDAIDRVFPRAAAYPIAVERDYNRNLPPLLMQPRHLRDTLINILQNAREALHGNPHGRITARARALQDNSLEIIIEDNGPGIPAERREQVFEAYFTTKEKGTGLGLASAKHNVEVYGGSIHLDSELGRGARFTLFFPAATAAHLGSKMPKQ